jgi:hypothetical protein
MAYIGTTPLDVRSFGTVKFEFTATAGQTAFTGSDDNGKTLGFTEGQIEVYVNGVLMDSDDFTTSGGNTVTLGSAAAADDIITVNTLKSNAPITDYVQTTGGTFSGDVTVEGAFTSQGIDDNATSTAMTLDSSGRLLVGKTSFGLASDGVQLGSTNSAFTASNNIPVYVNRNTNHGGLIDFQKDGSTVGSIDSSFGNLLIRGAGDKSGLRFDTNSFTPFKNGSEANGTVDLGYANGRFKDLYLSGGVYLGGTGSANKLDDYEEGTWDSRPSTSQSSFVALSGFGYGTNSGSYVKIGRLVICQYYFEWTNTTSSTSTVYLNLPFAVNSTTNQWSGNGTEFSKVDLPSGATWATVRPENNQSYATFKACGDQLSRVDMKFNHFGALSGGYALGSFCYQTSA